LAQIPVALADAAPKMRPGRRGSLRADHRYAQSRCTHRAGSSRQCGGNPCTRIRSCSAKRALRPLASLNTHRSPGTLVSGAPEARQLTGVPSVRHGGWFLDRPQARCAISTARPPPHGTRCLLRASGARSYFSTRRKAGCRRFGVGGDGGGRMIPASSKSSRTCSLIKSRTLAEAISRASSSTGCGLDHCRCS
jgi:hypothetical protein